MVLLHEIEVDIYEKFTRKNHASQQLCSR